MDGSNVEDLFEQQLLVESIQVDPNKEMIYWANWEIKKGEMDGASSALSSSVFHVLHMELDSESGTLYWIDQGVDLVHSAYLPDIKRLIWLWTPKTTRADISKETFEVHMPEGVAFI